MDCRDFELRLEALLDGRLDNRQRRRCARHLAGCPSCRQLVEPFESTAAPPQDLVDAVLNATSGSPCRRAESLLCGWLDGELSATEHGLVAAHVGSCRECRTLAATVTRLTGELPRLADLRPDPGFVEAVLAATLPVRVRLRRWWAAVWPHWVRRPRFASEAAFIATMVLVLVVATPGSPLGAMPPKALELATTDPTERLEAPVAALQESFAARVSEPLGRGYARGETAVRAWAEAAQTQGGELVDRLAAWIGTSQEALASLLGSADETASDSKTDESNPTRETP